MSCRDEDLLNRFDKMGKVLMQAALGLAMAGNVFVPQNGLQFLTVDNTCFLC